MEPLHILGATTISVSMDVPSREQSPRGSVAAASAVRPNSAFPLPQTGSLKEVWNSRLKAWKDLEASPPSPMASAASPIASPNALASSPNAIAASAPSQALGSAPSPALSRVVQALEWRLVYDHVVDKRRRDEARYASEASALTTSLAVASPLMPEASRSFIGGRSNPTPKRAAGGATALGKSMRSAGGPTNLAGSVNGPPPSAAPTFGSDGFRGGAILFPVARSAAGIATAPTTTQPRSLMCLVAGETGWSATALQLSAPSATSPTAAAAAAAKTATWSAAKWSHVAIATGGKAPALRRGCAWAVWDHAEVKEWSDRSENGGVFQAKAQYGSLAGKSAAAVTKLGSTVDGVYVCGGSANSNCAVLDDLWHLRYVVAAPRAADASPQPPTRATFGGSQRSPSPTGPDAEGASTTVSLRWTLVLVGGSGPVTGGKKPGALGQVVTKRRDHVMCAVSLAAVGGSSLLEMVQPLAEAKNQSSTHETHVRRRSISPGVMSNDTHQSATAATNNATPLLIAFGGCDEHGSALASPIMYHPSFATVGWQRLPTMTDVVGSGAFEPLTDVDTTSLAATPCARSHHAMTVSMAASRPLLFVYGGVAPDSNLLCDLWYLPLRFDSLLPPRWQRVQLPHEQVSRAIVNPSLFDGLAAGGQREALLWGLSNASVHALPPIDAPCDSVALVITGGYTPWRRSDAVLPIVGVVVTLTMDERTIQRAPTTEPIGGARLYNAAFRLDSGSALKAGSGFATVSEFAMVNPKPRAVPPVINSKKQAAAFAVAVAAAKATEAQHPFPLACGSSRIGIGMLLSEYPPGGLSKDSPPSSKPTSPCETPSMASFASAAGLVSPIVPRCTLLYLGQAQADTASSFSDDIGIAVHAARLL
jgi:hypothetical protein